MIEDPILATFLALLFFVVFYRKLGASDYN